MAKRTSKAASRASRKVLRLHGTIARDIGVPVNELATIVNAGPGSARLLEKMLAALNVDSRILVENPAAERAVRAKNCGAAGQVGPECPPAASWEAGAPGRR